MRTDLLLEEELSFRPPSSFSLALKNHVDAQAMHLPWSMGAENKGRGEGYFIYPGELDDVCR